MSVLRVYSAAEQVANHLRQELSKGVWTGKMPGGASLCRELGVGRMTVDAALDLLEKEGVLVSQGAGRSRLIPQATKVAGLLRVAVLPLLADDLRVDYVMDFQHHLQEEGHTVILSCRSVSGMGFDVAKVARLVKETPADAWVVIAGPRDVLSWFAGGSIPAFALFGRRRGLPIASIGPDKEKAYRSLVKRLVDLGHRRICLLARPLRRLPVPGLPEQAFLHELRRSGISIGSYNLPEWDGKADSLGGQLDALWRFTPPTAMIVDEPPLFLSVRHHLARRGVLAPEHVSLVCTDGDPYFDLQRPSIAHISWDSRPWVRRIVAWANGISRGKDDRRQSLTNARFVEGGSVGPAP